MSGAVCIPRGSDGRRYEAVLRLSEALSSCREPEELTKILSEQMREFLDFLQFYIIVYKEKSAEVEWAVVGREKSLMAAYADVPVEQRPSWQAYSTQQPFHIRNWSTDERVPARLKQGIAAQGLDVGPLVFVPLTTPHRRLGALGMSGPPGAEYGVDDISFLRLIGRVVAFAIDDNFNLRRAEAAQVELQRQNDLLQRSERELREVIERIPGMAWTGAPDGSSTFVNRRWSEYTGLSLEDAAGSGWQIAVHPDDLEGTVEKWRTSVTAGEPFEHEVRFRRVADGQYRWFLVRGVPLRDELGEILKWYGIATDIEDRKRAEGALGVQNNRMQLLLKLTNRITSNLKFRELLRDIVANIRELIQADAAGIAFFDEASDKSRIYAVDFPSARGSVKEEILVTPGHAFRRAWESCKPVTVTTNDREELGSEIYDLVIAEGLNAHCLIPLVSRDRPVAVLILAHKGKGLFTGEYIDFLSEASGQIAIAIENAMADESLHLQVDVLRHMPAVAWTVLPDGTPDFANQQWLDYTGQTLDYVRSSPEAWMQALHPDDRDRAAAIYWQGVRSGEGFAMEARFRRASDGVYRWHLNRGVPLRDSSGNLIKLVGTSIDIEEVKQAEQALQHERDRLRLLLDLNNRVAYHLDIAQLFLAISTELRRVFKFDFVGLALPDSSGKYLRQHMIDCPESKGLLKEGTLYPMEGSLSGLAFCNAKRVVINTLAEGRSIWSSNQAFYELVTDEGPFQSGCFLPLIGDDGPLGVLQLTSRAEHSVAEQDVEFLDQVANQTAITLKNALEYEQVSETKDRLHDENLALREQIDHAFMFEEIVGASPVLQTVLTSIVKVAPTDSTVLISGETGTGKELIARAIHKRSRRSGQAFISVNCASIPASLIASELFGHEKGAFTGALQQRQGRFELAHRGTIFLDEIGELPAETQISLLRVLQERQFERVGGSKIIPADVRVIAATNRDLSAAIAAGTFRSDLFYRLDVFPIQVPPLRLRKDDIPILVEYFVKRFAEKMGKQISKIDKKTIELCQRYNWPGNIRELQNIVERSVILCSGGTFWIDHACLSLQTPSRADLSRPLEETLQNQEREIIEAALAESKGRVAGPNGAAVKLGIPRSTLERRIEQFKIKKHKFSPEP